MNNIVVKPLNGIWRGYCYVRYPDGRWYIVRSEEVVSIRRGK